MIAYDIVKEPTGIDYTCFIDSACDLSDAVMMVFCVRQGSKQQHSVMKETRHKLALWRIKSRHNPEWPITKSFDDRVALDRKSTRLNSSHPTTSRMPSSA